VVRLAVVEAAPRRLLTPARDSWGIHISAAAFFASEYR
jgi:hypothetical protein